MIHVRKDQIHPRKQLHPCEAIFTSLLLRPGVFACRKTLLSGVQIVKDQLDVDGLYVLQEGKSTVCALKEIEAHYRAARDALASSDSLEVQVPGFSQSLVDTFEAGLAVDVVMYPDGYDRLTHCAFECNRALDNRKLSA